MLVEALPVLAAGLGLGLMHALDADHVMAVSVLCQEKPGLKRALRQGGGWALGHGGVLMTCGLLLFCFGIAIPQTLQVAAELSIGVLLIVLGVMCFLRVRKDRLMLACHRHGEIVHTHWHDGADKHSAKQHHRPVLVGMMHGLAGSAPALALIPVVAQGQVLFAVCYLVLFSFGVMVAMMCFGLGFAQVQSALQQRYRAAFNASRHALAACSIFFGSYWILHAA